MQDTNEGFGGSGEAGGGGGHVYHFGEALRHRRHMLGYTQRQVAEHVNTHASVITKLEQRMRPPRNRVLLAKLADFYLCTFEELVAGVIPRGYPAHQVLGVGGVGLADFELGSTTDDSMRVRAAIREITAGLEMLGDLAPEELLNIACTAIEMYKRSGSEG